MTSLLAAEARRLFSRTCLGVFLLAANGLGAVDIKASTVEYIHTDSLGTPIAITDANRVVIERSEYEPYGKLLNRPLADGPGFTGHVQDMATGMTYMQQRYYDPMIGRFLSVDPVAAGSGTGANFNRYWYANSNPYKYIDPDGRYRCYAGPSCKKFDDAIQRARKALRRAKKNSDSYKRLKNVLDNFGEKDTDGVEIYDAKLDEGTLANRESKNRINIDFSQTSAFAKRYASQHSGISKSTTEVIAFGIVAVHEGSHDYDSVTMPGIGTKFPNSRSMRKHTEVRAYGLDLYYEALEGMVSPNATIDQLRKSIDKDADASVNSACEGTESQSCR